MNSCAVASQWEASIAVVKAAAGWLEVVPDAISGDLMAFFPRDLRSQYGHHGLWGAECQAIFSAQVLGRRSGSRAWRSSSMHRSIESSPL